MTHPVLQPGPYPFWREEANLLHRRLAQRFPDQQVIARLYHSCAANLRPLNIGQGPDLVWQQALEELARAGLLPRLIEVVTAEGPLGVLAEAIDAVKMAPPLLATPIVRPQGHVLPAPTPTRSYYRDFDLKLFYRSTNDSRRRQGWVEAIGVGDRSDEERLKLSWPAIEPHLEYIRSGQADRETCEEVGALLFEALFPTPIRDSWRRHQALMLPDSIVRLRLDIRHHDLALLPWEILHDDKTPLVMSPRQPIVRYPMRTMRTEKPVRQGPLRVLMVTLGSRASAARLEMHARLVTESLAPLIDEGILRIDVVSVTSTRALERSLADQHHVLHCIGPILVTPRGQAVLEVTNDRGESELVDGRSLGQLLFGSTTAVLVLESVDGGGEGPDGSGTASASIRVADAASSAVSGVIAMHGTLSPTLSAAFAEGFYTVLARHAPLEACITAARKGMLAAGPQRADWTLPVLFTSLLDGQPWHDMQMAQELSGEAASAVRIGESASTEDRTKRQPARTPSGARAASRREPIPSNIVVPVDFMLLGRDDEVSEVMRALEPDSGQRLIAISGPPGAGCTSLAREVARQCVEISKLEPESTHAFQGVVWGSRRQLVIRLTDETGPQALLGLRLDDVYLAIASTVGQPAMLKARPEDRIEVLRDALQERRYLLVIDGADELAEDDRNKLLSLLAGDRASGAPSKLLITGHRIEARDWQLNDSGVLSLQGLPDDAAKRLLARDGAGTEAVEHASDAQLQTLAESARRLPLPMRWAVALLADSGQSTAELAEELSNCRRQKLSDFCLARLAGRLTTEERDLLVACALFPQPMLSGAARAMSGLTAAQQGHAFEHLKRLRLVTIDGAKRIQLTNRVRRYALTRLDTPTQRIATMSDAGASFALNRVRRLGGGKTLAGRKYLASELGNVLWAARHYHKRGDHKKVLRMRELLHDFMFEQRHYNEGIVLGEWSFQSACVMQRHSDAAWCALYPLARQNFHHGNYEAAEKWCREAFALFSSLRDHAGLASAARYLGRIFQARDCFDEAERVFEFGRRRALRSVPSSSKKVGELVASLAGVAQAKGDFPAAKRRFEEALELYETTSDWESIAATLRSLGEVSLAMHHYDEAEQRLRESMERSAGEDWPAGRAKIVYIQACLAEARGSFTLARELLEDAQRAFYSLSDVPNLVRVDATLARVVAALQATTATSHA